LQVDRKRCELSIHILFSKFSHIFYKQIEQRYVPTLIGTNHPALRAHDHVPMEAGPEQPGACKTKCYKDGLHGVLLLPGVCVRGRYAEEKGTEGALQAYT
jgi:hypothetical protein